MNEPHVCDCDFHTGGYLNLDDADSVERLADAMTMGGLVFTFSDERLNYAAAIIAALRGVNGLPSTPDGTADPA